MRDPLDLTSLSFPKIDTIPVNYHEYYNLLPARAQMIGRLLLEWRTQQALEYENKTKQYTKEEIFQDDQMVYLLAPHSSALQTDTTKFKQDFIGPLFIDTALDKTHYRLKDATELLLDGTYHMNKIKKGSACTLQGIVSTFDGYKKALKNILFNKFAIETPDNKIQEGTLEDGLKELIIFLGLIWIMPQFMAKRSVMPKFRKMNKVNYRQEDEIVNSPHSCTSLECSIYRTSKDGEIDIIRCKRDTGIQYRHEKKMSRDSSQNQSHNPSMKQYINIKVGYCNTITTIERLRSPVFLIVIITESTEPQTLTI